MREKVYPRQKEQQVNGKSKKDASEKKLHLLPGNKAMCQQYSHLVNQKIRIWNAGDITISLK